MGGGGALVLPGAGGGSLVVEVEKRRGGWRRQRRRRRCREGERGRGEENRDPRDPLLAGDAARRERDEPSGERMDGRARTRWSERGQRDAEGGRETVNERNGRVGGPERGNPRRRVFPGAPGAKVRERDAATPFPRSDVAYNRTTSTSTATTATTTTTRRST